MVDSSDVMMANSNAFQYKLEVIEFHIKKATKPFLADDEGSILCVETGDPDVVRVLLAQILRTLKKEDFLKPNYNVIFTNFRSFTSMSLKQNEGWANNFPDLLVCKLDDDEKLEEHFLIIKSWVNIVKDTSKKVLFIVKDPRHLEKRMMEIGMANIFKLKLVDLWEENETTAKTETNHEVKNIEANLNVINNESTSARALDEDTNVNVIEESSGKTSLLIEATADISNLASLLQSLGVKKIDDVNRDGNTQLHLAASDGKTQIVQSLLDHGAKKNIKTKSGTTALHLAVQKRHSAIVYMLLERGCNVHATDTYQCTPLYYSCYLHNDAHLLEMLLKYGSGIERKNKYGRTALHLASSLGNNAVVVALLKHGADINTQDNDGSTPLHFATLWNKKEIVLILLKYGADFNIKNRQQENVLDLARSRKFTNIIQIFENYK